MSTSFVLPFDGQWKCGAHVISSI